MPASRWDLRLIGGLAVQWDEKGCRLLLAQFGLPVGLLGVGKCQPWSTSDCWLVFFGGASVTQNQPGEPIQGLAFEPLDSGAVSVVHNKCVA